MTAQTSALDTLLGSYQISPIISAWGEPDTKLMGVYTRLTSLPASPPSISLEGSYAPNMARQNHYFVFPGNGKTVQVTGTSTQDIALEAFQTGISQGGADDTTSGPNSGPYPASSIPTTIAIPAPCVTAALSCVPVTWASRP